MKYYLSLLAFFAISQLSNAEHYNIICFYDTSSIERTGLANFTEMELKNSLEYCTHIVYGYVGLTAETFDIETLHPKQHKQFAQVRKLKKQYRHIKFLLSLGGGRDNENPEKYMNLLKTNRYNQQHFISSAKTFLQKYYFDGLDLAFQFPYNKLKQHSKIKKVFSKAKNLISKNSAVKKVRGLNLSKKIIDSNQILVHKRQFATFVNKIKNAFTRDRLMLTLTVLPHVNASEYINVSTIMGDFDFVNLGTYDYSTPERNPYEADFLAPLQAPSRHRERIPQTNIDYEVRQWLSHHINASKLNIGIAAYGRAWKMTKALKSSIMPITSSLDGPAQEGELTHEPGLLSWPEICLKLKKMSLTKDKKYGNYAYQSANVKGHEGLFITYEDQDSLGAKAKYVEKNSLGGVAIFDITLDDFRGKCKKGKFPALKAIKFKLN